MRSIRRSRACSLAGALVVALALASGGAAAASPSPEPSGLASERPPERPPFEVWLDRPMPANARPGDRVDVGATIWDRAGDEIPVLAL